MQLAWAPGRGVKGGAYRNFWNLDDGVSVIPWEAISSPSELAKFTDGGWIEPGTCPPGMSPPEPTKGPSMHSQHCIVYTCLPCSLSHYLIEALWFVGEVWPVGVCILLPFSFISTLFLTVDVSQPPPLFPPAGGPAPPLFPPQGMHPLHPGRYTLLCATTNKPCSHN